LEFDHINQETKMSCISEMIRDQRPWRVILKEIAKCEVRCANCHRRRTAKQRGYYLYLAKS
jgi:L-lysine 2,3-aminomutase